MPSSSKPIYFDNAAATPMLRPVVDAMSPYFGPQFANPSSIYTSARTTRAAVDDARKMVAELLGGKVTELVWTSGATEANNLAVQGVLKSFPGAHWVTTNIEHDAILAQVEPLGLRGNKATIIAAKSNGIVDAFDIERAITDHTVLVSVMLANNEIGTIQPVPDVAKAVRQIRLDRKRRGIELPIYLHTDAVQGANYLSLHVERLGVDLMSLTGSKIYGPKGSGLLYVRTGTRLEPLQYGGGQERGRRSGTENVAGIVGFATAFALVQSDRTAEGRWLSELRDDLAKRLQLALPNIIINGDMAKRLPNNLNITIPGAEGEGLVLYLDQAGIQVSTGSACSSGDLDPSHVLLAVGRTPQQADNSLRITLGRSTEATDIDRLLQALPPIVARLRELAAG